MIVSIDWLKTFVDITVLPEELADFLTNGGHETGVLPGGTTLDIELTPNRPDCTSHRGIAREIAVLTGGSLKPFSIDLQESSKELTSNFISIEIDALRECPRYAARIVRNVNISSSPSWITKRLEACGLRSINNIVDISNYVLFELGHPLHTFDLFLVEENKIVVKTAENGEIFQTLDGEEHQLNSDHLLICDDIKPIALAGIMGGANTEVNIETTDVLIESAYFDPVTIRKGAKALNLSTEASKRFERGTDYKGLITALDRCASLIAEFSGGEVLQGIVDVYPQKFPVNKVILRKREAISIIGTDFSDSFIEKTLNGLDIKFSTVNGDKICTQPSFRPDLEREIDIIEELARIYGYGEIKPDTSYHGILGNNLEDEENPISQLKQFFVSQGFHEVVSNSLLNKREAKTFTAEDIVTLQNPLSQELAAMRPSLFAGLIKAISYNLRRGEKDLAIFEVGNTFSKSISSLTGTEEKLELSGIICGNKSPKEWKGPVYEFDYFSMKGYMDALVLFLKAEGTQFRQIKDHQIFSSGQILLSNDGKVLAHFGVFLQSLLSIYDITIAIYGFTVNLPNVLYWLSKPLLFQHLSIYPGIARDLSFVVDDEISVGEVSKIVNKIGGQILKQLTLYDLYKGDQVEKGKKSITFNLFFQDSKRTLTDEEVDVILETIISETSKELNAKLR